MADKVYTYQEHLNRKLPYVKTEYGVKYLDFKSVVRVCDEDAARAAAADCAGSVVVTRSVNDWLELK